MKFKDVFEETYLALSVNKVRSGLTVLGIVIGIASVIAMISIGAGAQSSIESSIQSIGSNLLLVYPSFARGVGQQVRGGFGSATTLTLDDANAISSQVQNIAAVAPQATANSQVIYDGQNTNAQVIGTTPDYTQVRNVEISQGNFFSDSDVQQYNMVAVLGPTVVSDIFATGTNPIGATIRIKNYNFKVIGVTIAQGGAGGGGADSSIYVPISVVQHYFTGNDAVSTINIEVASSQDMTQAQNDITNLLLQRHGISNPAQADFQVLNQASIIQTASAVTGTFTTLLGSIAGISLLVGGIGIMNMMLTTVTERTREIGLRKAIGAKRKDISTQFLMEAVMLTGIGGILGVLLGYLISVLITAITGTATAISMESVILAFGVSAVIG
ncbi:ABC transporter permease, partial [Patescibacteria group bacterium]|nr:ABC transporter permease [Patescibacteria group bacterium]